MYDDKVREFGEGVGLENIGKRLVNNREKVEFVKPEMSLDKLLKYGQFLVDEQARHAPALLLQLCFIPRPAPDSAPKHSQTKPAAVLCAA